MLPKENSVYIRAIIAKKLEEVLMRNKPPPTWNIAEFTAVLRVLKTKDDGPMPKKKPELFALFERLKHKSVELLNYEAAINENNDAGFLDAFPETSTQIQQQTDVSLSSEERDAAFLLGRMFESV